MPGPLEVLPPNDARYKFEQQALQKYKDKSNHDRNEQYEQNIQKIQQKFEEELAKVKKARFIKNSQGGEETDFQHAISKAHSETVKAYDGEWKFTMLSLIEMLYGLNLAVHGATKEKGVHLKFYVSTFTEKVLNHFRKEDLDNLNYSALLYGVTLNDDGAIEVSITEKQSPSDSDKPDFNTEFKEVVVQWLKANNYVPHPNRKDQFVHRLTGDPLTKDQLEKLKNAPITSIKDYLHTGSNFIFEENLVPRPGLSV